MTDIVKRLEQSAMGACTCGTKSPDVMWHDPACRYAVLLFAADTIEHLRELLANALPPSEPA